MRGSAWRTTLLGVRKVSSRANGEASRGRQVRYEKVKTRRASRTWPNHAKCPASVSPTVRCITVRLSSRENIARTHTHTHICTRRRRRGRHRSRLAHTWLLQICIYTHTYNECGISGQAGSGQVSRCKPPLSNERELSERASEREKVTAEAENHSLCRHHTDPSAKNQCDHPAKNSLILFILRRWPSFFYPPCCSSEDTPDHVNTELRARCEKELEEPRGLRTNEFPFWFRESNLQRIARVETTGKTTKHRARYRFCWHRGRSLSTGKRDGRKIASYATRVCVSFEARGSRLRTIRNRLSRDLQILSMR